MCREIVEACGGSCFEKCSFVYNLVTLVLYGRESSGPDRSVRELYDDVSNLLNHSRDFSCGAVDHAELRLFDFPRFRVKATWFWIASTDGSID